MSNSQPSKSGKYQKLSPGARWAAAGVFALIAAGIGLLRASAQGTIDLTFWLGICGFKQRFGLPCPGCGWTHAAQAFFTGHPGQAVVLQPAAAFFCLVAVLAALFALHAAVFGIDFGFLKSLFGTSGGISVLLIVTVVVILAGWAVTLVRTILEGSG